MSGVHLDVAAPDVDDLYAELVRRGAPIEGPPSVSSSGLREVVVADPNGIRVRFYAPDVGSSSTG